MPISQCEFDLIRNLVLRRSGIVLEDGKEYLVEARLTTVARKAGCASISELASRLRSGPADLERAVVDAMTTNETSFFRDLYPFESLRTEILPRLIERRKDKRRLSIWCAASSTGQEPYTLAMLIREHFPQLADWDIAFTASDLATTVLERAKSGSFSQLEVNRGLPAKFLVKYFEKRGLEWQIAPTIRKMIDFRQINLLESWPVMPAMDMIFIRNVLIYFSPATRKQILQRLRGLMRPDAYLFLGVAETTLNIDDQLVRSPFEKSGCHHLRAATAVAA